MTATIDLEQLVTTAGDAIVVANAAGNVVGPTGTVRNDHPHGFDRI